MSIHFFGDLISISSQWILTQAVPGHSNWASFHIFSAALFFCFQLISDPNQPGASHFRASIQRAAVILEQSPYVAVADKAFKILDALSPLYSSDFSTEGTEAREEKRARVLSLVRNFTFPYHDSPRHPRSSMASLRARASLNSPTDSAGSILSSGFDFEQQVLPPISSIRNDQQQLPLLSHTHLSPSQPNSQDHHMSIPPLQNYPSLDLPPPYNQPPEPQGLSQGAYANPGDEAMWGAAIGFGQAEWLSFLDAMQSAGPSWNAS